MQEINQFVLNVFEESNIFKEEWGMARTGRPKKQMLRRKNHEGTVYEKNVIKEK